jgi:hypothetical protein
VDAAHYEVVQAGIGVVGANNVMNAVRGTPNEWMGVAALAEAEARRAGAEAAEMQALNSPNSQVYDVASQSAAAGVEAAREMFDAIRLSFELTPDADLAQPYYAVIAQIRERDSKPDQVRKWAYVRSLGPISAGATRKVNVYQGGLPRGYILESWEVHLYDHGKEVATSLSRKRVPLTDEEALEFRIIEYVGANKGRTLPAAPLTTTLTSEVRASLTADQLVETCYVRVAKDGRVAAAFRDPAGQQPLQDPELESALRTFRFTPALEAGKPVESIAPVKLAQPPSP